MTHIFLFSCAEDIMLVDEMFVTEYHETVWHCVRNTEVKMHIGGTKYI